MKILLKFPIASVCVPRDRESVMVFSAPRQLSGLSENREWRVIRPARGSRRDTPLRSRRHVADRGLKIRARSGRIGNAK